MSKHIYHFIYVRSLKHPLLIITLIYVWQQAFNSVIPYLITVAALYLLLSMGKGIYFFCLMDFTALWNIAISKWLTYINHI